MERRTSAHITTGAVTHRRFPHRDWLKKPCRYLDNNIPLELVDNTLGFQVVEDYLTRVEYGVYQ